MIRQGDISAAVRTVLEAASGWATACPGGYWLDAGPDEPAGYPWTLAKVEKGETEATAGNYFVQRWTVRLAGYVPVGGGGDPDALEGLWVSALADKTTGFTLRGAGQRVMRCRQAPGSGRYDPTQRDGRDVYAAGAAFELLCQGNRGID